MLLLIGMLGLAAITLRAGRRADAIIVDLVLQQRTADARAQLFAFEACAELGLRYRA